MRLDTTALLPRAYHAADVKAFIDRWRGSHGHERAHKDQFFLELCDVLGVERPAPGDSDFCFEKHVMSHSRPAKKKTAGLAGPECALEGRVRFIDFYKLGHFVIEAKQGSERGQSQGTAVRGTWGWAQEMKAAYVQGLDYANSLTEGRPRFLITCDIGYCFEVWDCFDGNYGDYRAGRRIPLEALGDPGTFQFFVDLFADPGAQDPRKKAAPR